jgi:hypothetical protein
MADWLVWAFRRTPEHSFMNADVPDGASAKTREVHDNTQKADI